MTDIQREKLMRLGINLNEVMERFINNEALYFRCLGKFLDDANYSNMCAAIDEKNASNAFEYSHALKGVCGNLGFTRLYEEVKVITEIFRAGSMEYDEDNLNRIKNEYSSVVDTISAI